MPARLNPASQTDGGVSETVSVVSALRTVVSPGPAAFRRALARLAPGAFVRFVADVHAARESVEAVERDGGVLVVRGAETRRVLPVADRRGPFRGPAPVGTVAAPVDEVVAQVDADAAREVAAGRGARYRSPSDLYARVRYGLSPATGRRLFADHLDLDPDGGGDRGAVPGLAGRRRALLAVAAAVVVVAGLAAGAVPVDSPAVLPATSGTSTPGATVAGSASGPSGAGAPAATVETDGDPYPPGVDADGVEDAVALSRAHVAAVEARYYRWTVVAGRTGATWAGVDVEAAGPRSVVRAISDRPANATGNVSFRTYSSGNYTYVGITGPNGTRYVRETVRRPAGADGRFVTRSMGYVSRYLSGTGGTVTPVEAAGLTVYRVTVRTPPADFAGTVSNYTATAIVTREGFVVALDVSYIRHGGSGPTAVAFQFAYSPYSRTADPTPWYEAMRAATNGTGPLSPGSGD